ncbi:hypothetical protein ZWY2020_030512 [Hordeum vulgare]|nr:hypothetical protein ZWY2020_030512 [Hordeum vulgare]
MRRRVLLRLRPPARGDASARRSRPQPLRRPPSSAYRLLALLRSCVAPSHLPLGLRIHARAVTSSLLAAAEGNVPAADALHTRLIGMYVLTRRFRDAVAVFSSLPRAAASSALPGTGSSAGSPWRAPPVGRALLRQDVGPPSAPRRTHPPLRRQVVRRARALALNRLVHRTAQTLGLDRDMYVGSALIKMYADAGLLGRALVFDGMAERDCVLWNVMMDGVQIHTLAVKYRLEPEVAVANTLVSMYAKCQCLDDAWRLFDLMPRDDLVTWNGMISGCVQNGLVDDALRLFCDMQKSGLQPDSVTLASLLPALTDLNGFKQGKEIHGYIVRNCVHLDVFLVSALVDIYFKCRDVRMAQNVFDATKTIDVVIGSTMISGYVLNGMSEGAVKMFRYLLEVGIKPNAVMVASTLPACACMAAMKLSQELHGHVLKNAYEGRCYVEVH